MLEAPDVVDDVDVAVAGDASPCSVVGTVEVTCDKAAWVLVLADVPVAWVVAAACPASALGAVV